MDVESTCRVLQASQDGLARLEAFDSEAIEALLRPMAKELDVKVGQVLGTLRVAATGLKVSPPIFETLEAMGQERAVRAIHAALDRLQTGATRYS
jgi:glutamyl-tRNA synthetase